MAPSVPFSNLQNFLFSVTPVVPSKPLPQSYLPDLNSTWHPKAKEVIEYFTLGDLWSCFDEWSAYGVGTPVVLCRDRTVMQYYAPYLSAIQIYTVKGVTKLSNPGEETNAIDQFELESWSDGSEADKLSRSLSDNSNKTWDGTSGGSSVDHEGSCSMRDRFGDLYFQYQDISSPYWRVPMAEKIMDFAQRNPGLTTLRSVDLSPASWMSIAWYPIYQIPTKWYVRDLAACFLTYHTLSSSFQDTIWENDTDDDGKESSCQQKKKSQNRVTLPPFGLATYKMQGDVWVNHGKEDHERIIDLHSAADSWLKQLDFYHHDFNFFNLHSSYELGSV